MDNWHPNRIIAKELYDEWTNPIRSQTQVEVNGEWVVARWVSVPTLRQRLRMAWDVFNGTADALYWPR